MGWYFLWAVLGLTGVLFIWISELFEKRKRKRLGKGNANLRKQLKEKGYTEEHIKLYIENHKVVKGWHWED